MAPSRSQRLYNIFPELRSNGKVEEGWGYFCEQNSLVDVMQIKKQAVSGKLNPEDKEETIITNWMG